MRENYIREMRAFHTTYQVQRGQGKPYWKTERTVSFTRTDGVERIYGCRPVDMHGDELIETPSLTERQWNRLKRVYDRLIRRMRYVHETDYHPGRLDTNNQPYWYLYLMDVPF